jgi:glutathione S-transferase
MDPSLVLLEFVADLYSDSGLLPKDSIQRAHVRFFIDTVTNKVSPAYIGFVFRGVAPVNFIAALAEPQELLPPSGSGFTIGDHFTIPDAAVVPLIGGWELFFRNNVGTYAERTASRCTR